MGIAGVTLTPLKTIADTRGAVLHFLRNDDPQFHAFGEVYFSEVATGAIKGWKLHRKQTQQLCVPHGRVKFALFDARPDSPTRGKIQEITLGRPDRYARLSIPPGVWYLFGCVSEAAALVANCADMPHDPAESETRPLGDDFFPYAWNPA